MNQHRCHTLRLGSEPSFTAWAISGVFHVSVILLMALAISDVPRGVRNAGSRFGRHRAAS